MSTTFGIKVLYEHLLACASPCPFDYDDDFEDGTVIIEVAYQYHLSGAIEFTNPIAHLLPDDTLVFDMYNENQRFNTIGDIKKEINKLTIDK